MASKPGADDVAAFREAVRDKVLHSILFFAVLLLLLSLAMEDIAIGDTEKVVRGVALGGISMMGGIIAIFLLAIVIDILIMLIGRLITPWARAKVAA